MELGKQMGSIVRDKLATDYGGLWGQLEDYLRLIVNSKTRATVSFNVEEVVDMVTLDQTWSSSVDLVLKQTTDYATRKTAKN